MSAAILHFFEDYLITSLVTGFIISSSILIAQSLTEHISYRFCLEPRRSLTVWTMVFFCVCVVAVAALGVFSLLVLWKEHGGHVVLASLSWA